MKIRLGPAGAPRNCSSSEDGIKEVAKLGLHAMEIEFVYGVKMSLDTAKIVGETAKKNNIRLSIHAPYFINLLQQDKEKLERSKKHIYDSAKRADVMGAKVIVFHPGAYMGLSKEDAMKQMISVCKEISKKVSVKLGLELTGKQGQFGTIDEIIEVCKHVSGCIPIVDFAHAYARNAGCIDYEEIFKKLNVLGLKKYHFHFSGINYTTKDKGVGNEKHHEPISNNKPPFKELAKTILKHKKDVTIICESPYLEKDSLKMKKTFEALGFKF